MKKVVVVAFATALLAIVGCSSEVDPTPDQEKQEQQQVPEVEQSTTNPEVLYMCLDTCRRYSTLAACKAACPGSICGTWTYCP